MTNYHLSFTFDDNTVVCPHIKVNEVLFRNSDVLKMLRKNHCDSNCGKVTILNLKMFHSEAFTHFIKCIEYDERFSLCYFYEIVDIICYLLLDQVLVDLICPSIPIGHMRTYLKAMHQLLCHGYIQTVEKLFTECRLPTFLCRNFDKSFHKFKKKFCSTARFQEWFVTKCQISCCCEKCTRFRSDRFLQLFDGGEYATPFFAQFKKSPLKTE